jgi:glycosyltransferase involved in cell wall biosynthesis
MNDTVIFLSDFYLNEVRGGAEYCNKALIDLLKKNRKVKCVKSVNVSPSFIEENKDCFFIVANFFQLSEEAKEALAGTTYAIYEHDHKYIKSNNPVLWPHFLAPQSQIINKEFYKNALVTVCQSRKHAEILQKNLCLNNISSFGGNIWTPAQLKILETNLDTEKTIDYATQKSLNKNKGMPAALQYCKNHKLEFSLLEEAPFDKFIANLAKVRTLIFFPQWFESYSRIAIEAKILGCKLITNKLLGAASEPYFKQSGRELLETIKSNNENLWTRWDTLIKNNEVECITPLCLPKVSVIVPLYKGEKYIEGFLKDMEQQTIFDSCELIIINANSPENEEDFILPFVERNSNVLYEKLDYVASVMETENMAIEMSTGEYIAQACVDDRHSAESLEILAKQLYFNPHIDLAYGDCLETRRPNETFDENSSDGQLYEHSQKEFTKENMIKCLPGPMPMWRKNIHAKIGVFNPQLRRAGDWEFFLRMVDSGSQFKKVDVPIGLYYHNSEGLSTAKSGFKDKIKEESIVFDTYRHIFGERNYEMYKSYFHQFDEEAPQ